MDCYKCKPQQYNIVSLQRNKVILQASTCSTMQIPYQFPTLFYLTNNKFGQFNLSTVLMFKANPTSTALLHCFYNNKHNIPNNSIDQQCNCNLVYQQCFSYKAQKTLSLFKHCYTVVNQTAHVSNVSVHHNNET